MRCIGVGVIVVLLIVFVIGHIILAAVRASAAHRKRHLVIIGALTGAHRYSVFLRTTQCDAHIDEQLNPR